ncbi:hypothetical protein C4577_07755 [Candidatus Parcubacteria bacterium]|nr:MAG: hypothetical protein C4577_07755 [Candidatus Parcubacteria bacterium]
MSPEVTYEELQKMSLPEKVHRHALDVMETENNVECLRGDFQVVGGVQDGVHQAEHSAAEGEYVYDFLFGGGSLGHPLRPSIFGEGVLKVAELVGTNVAFLDFTYARFEKKINPAAIERAFFPVFEMSERLKKLPQPVSQAVIDQQAQQARLTLSHIKLIESK